MSDTPQVPPTLDALANEAEQLGAAAPSEGAATAPGAAPGAPPAEAKLTKEQASEMLAKLLFTTFRVTAPAWNVSQPECEMLGGSYVEVIAKYFPDFDLGPEVLAIGVTLAVFGPRWGQPRKFPPPKKPEPAPAPAAP